MSDFTPYVDLDTRKLTDETGAAFALPTLVLADVFKMSLRGMRRTSDGVREVRLNLRSLKASIGPTMGLPEAGGARLRFGNTAEDPETAAPVIFSAAADALKTALTGVSDDWTPAEVVLFDASCWLVRFEEQDGPAPLQVGTVNTLTPRSIVRVRAYQLNGVWWHELRFIQAPFAFTNAYADVLPPPPSIAVLQEGGSDSGSDDIVVNEIQQLTLPRSFRGTYVIQWQGRTSAILGIEDGPEQIAAALNGMWQDQGTRFSVTNLEADKANIEFVGALGDENQPLMTVTVRSFQPGAPTFTMVLDTAEMAAGMRSVASLDKTTLVLSTGFELELLYVNEDEDPAAEDVPSRRLTLQLPVKVAREQIYPELETVPQVDYLNGWVAKDYVPVTPDQVITGDQHYIKVIGNGVATEIIVAHPLATDELAGPPSVRENLSGGRILGYGTEYTATVDSASQVTLTFGVAPALNSLVVCIKTAGPASAFQAHTHTIGQIVGLQAVLDDYGSRIAVLEDLAPSLTRVTEAAGEDGQEIPIDEFEEIFPRRRSSTLTAAAALADPSKLPRGLALLPAIHDATVTALTVPLVDPATVVGSVFQNQTGDEVLLTGGYGQRSIYLPDDGYAGSDGRVIYPVTHSGTSTSYFPTAFERDLFLLTVADTAWKSGERFVVEFDLDLRMLAANTRCIYVLTIQTGTAPAATSPATTDPLNLSLITWDAEPILTQRLVVMPNIMTHHFGARIKRSGSDVMSADQLKYRNWSASTATPAAPTFVIRARLERFDTEDNVSRGIGFIYRKLSEASAHFE